MGRRLTRSRLSRALAALAIGLLLASPASSAGQYCGPEPKAVPPQDGPFWKPMTFTVKKVTGGRIMRVEGKVGPNDGAALEAQLARAGNIDEVWLSSPGGSVTGGLAIGRVLRKRGLMVRIANDDMCISSCTLAFLGGTVRTIDSTAYYGIHMFSEFSDDRAAAYFNDLVKIANNAPKTGQDKVIYELRERFRSLEQASAQDAAALAAYLIEMSASLEFLTGMFGQEQVGVCYVTPAGLKRYNIVNLQ